MMHSLPEDLNDVLMRLHSGDYVYGFELELPATFISSRGQ